MKDGLIVTLDEVPTMQREKEFATHDAIAKVASGVAVAIGDHVQFIACFDVDAEDVALDQLMLSLLLLLLLLSKYQFPNSKLFVLSLEDLSGFPAIN